jgi:cyanate permease
LPDIQAALSLDDLGVGILNVRPLLIFAVLSLSPQRSEDGTGWSGHWGSHSWQSPSEPCCARSIWLHGVRGSWSAPFILLIVASILVAVFATLAGRARYID